MHAASYLAHTPERIELGVDYYRHRTMRGGHVMKVIGTGAPRVLTVRRRYRGCGTSAQSAPTWDPRPSIATLRPGTPSSSSSRAFSTPSVRRLARTSPPRSWRPLVLAPVI